MNSELCREIIACLTGERTVFYYHKDRYAVWLMQCATQAGFRVSDLKRSHWRSLLHRPVVAAGLARAGGGLVHASHFDLDWPAPVLAFTLTLGEWGGPARDRAYHQTSRAGQNLVLQLNFSRAHDRDWAALLDGSEARPFDWGCHPTCEGGRNTLAWARIDLDFESGEALIEEIQNDWLREALSARSKAKDAIRSSGPEAAPFYWTTKPARLFLEYFAKHLAPVSKIWDEAMLTAALFFVRKELGLRRIYYHTYEGGLRMKSRQWYTSPPRSLYTQLPGRFAFKRTERGPQFLARERRLRYRGDWFVHDL